MPHDYPISDLQRRFVSVSNKVKLLTSLRACVGLRAEQEISPSQWSAIEGPLATVAGRLHAELKSQGRRHLRQLHQARSQKELAQLLARTEVALASCFVYFDTFVDLLSQRHLPEMGRLLAGCDVLAWDALKKDHPALAALEKPLVSFNRGFGASILREGVTLPDGTPNPLATIQIPYTKIRDKYNLTSILHEAGHLALVQLGLSECLPGALHDALADAGAPEVIGKLFALWCLEIGPDFWGFCNCGSAEASGVMEILTLPSPRVFQVSAGDPHPPPFLRVLLAFEWCRQQWGAGDWDVWEQQWRMRYPLSEAGRGDRKVLATALRYLPAIARVLLHTPFEVLGRRSIPSLFDLQAVAPTRLERVTHDAEATGVLDLSQFSPCGQLAVFRMLRDKSTLSEEALDRLMTTWLVTLARGRRFKEPYA
jgi:hypothetical protein